MFARRLLAFLVLCAGIQLPATAAERMQAPGSAISMELPETFAPSSDAMGFLADRGTAAVALVSIPSSAEMWADLQKPGAFEEAFGGANPNLTLESVESLHLGGRDFLLAEGVSADASGAALKVWLVTTGPQPGLLINFSQVEGRPPQLNRERVLQALASLEESAPLSFAEQLLATGFTVSPQAPFVHNAVQMGSLIVLSTEREPVSVTQALKIAIMVPRGPAPTVPLEHLLDKYMGAAGRGADRVTETDVAFAGGRGMQAQGSNEGARVVAYVAETAGRLVIFVAQGPSDQFTDELVETVDQIAQSVAPVGR
jgi:hypothetical protein